MSEEVLYLELKQVYPERFTHLIELSENEFEGIFDEFSPDRRLTLDTMNTFSARIREEEWDILLNILANNKDKAIIEDAADHPEDYEEDIRIVSDIDE